MGYIDDILEEFQGQISVQDIERMTYKEIGYLRKHRQMIIKAKNKANQINPKDLKM